MGSGCSRRFNNEGGWSLNDLLCSRNARPQKALVGRAQWKIIQPPSLKRARASLEGSFISFRAFEDRPAYPSATRFVSTTINAPSELARSFPPRG